jgi:predicted Rdx family selenoprotein
MNSIKISRTPELVSTMMDDEMVLLNTDTGEYFVLNKVGALIWEQLESAAENSQIINEITKRFEVTREQAEHDFKGFLNELEEKGLISVSESA